MKWIWYFKAILSFPLSFFFFHTIMVGKLIYLPSYITCLYGDLIEENWTMKRRWKCLSRACIKKLKNNNKRPFLLRENAFPFPLFLAWNSELKLEFQQPSSVYDLIHKLTRKLTGSVAPGLIPLNSGQHIHLNKYEVKYLQFKV